MYLDTSVILAAHLDEAATKTTVAFLSRQSLIVISDFAFGETASGISRYVRTGSLTGENADAILADIERWAKLKARKVELVRTTLTVATSLVRRYELKLRLPDAIHVAISLDGGCGLVTLDEKMARAARSLGMHVAVPTA